MHGLHLKESELPSLISVVPGRVHLDDGDYDVEKRAGIYLGPMGITSIQAASGASLKLFHLVVPQIPR